MDTAGRTTRPRHRGPRRFQVCEDQDDDGNQCVSRPRVEESCRTAGVRDLRVSWFAVDPHQYLAHVRRSDA